MELLINAKNHWMDNLRSEEIAKLSNEQLAMYKARSQKGDVIVVKGDGWGWGREECLPNYVVVKLPGMPADYKLTEPLYDITNPEKPILLKRRKHQISETIVDSYLATAKSSVTILGTADKAAFVNNIVTKSK
jgi:hypothetical protein